MMSTVLSIIPRIQKEYPELKEEQIKELVDTYFKCLRKEVVTTEKSEIGWLLGTFRASKYLCASAIKTITRDLNRGNILYHRPNYKEWAEKRLKQLEVRSENRVYKEKIVKTGKLSGRTDKVGKEKRRLESLEAMNYANQFIKEYESQN